MAEITEMKFFRSVAVYVLYDHETKVINKRRIEYTQLKINYCTLYMQFETMFIKNERYTRP